MPPQTIIYNISNKRCWSTMPPQDLWLPPHTCLSRPGPVSLRRYAEFLPGAWLDKLRRPSLLPDHCVSESSVRNSSSCIELYSTEVSGLEMPPQYQTSSTGGAKYQWNPPPRREGGGAAAAGLFTQRVCECVRACVRVSVCNSTPPTS